MKLFLFALASRQDPVWVYAVVLGGLALVGVLIRLLDRVFPSNRSHASVGNALMRIEANLLPGREHIVEAQEHESVEEYDQGEPPETGGR